MRRHANGVTTVTNNSYRQMTFGCDIPKDIFDREFPNHHCNDEEDNTDQRKCLCDFFKYKGQWYELRELSYVGVNHYERLMALGWDGCHHHTVDSGIVVKYNPENRDEILVGRFY